MQIKYSLIEALLLLLVVHSLAFAQSDQVTGVVSDATTGEVLVGVNILIKGTTTGTSSDINGAFELSASLSSDTLVFTYLGYQQMEVHLLCWRAKM